MAYEKRLCILKQLKKGFTADGGPLSGAVFAERLGDTLTVTPRLAGLAPLSDGRYALAVCVGGQTYCFGLEGKQPLRAEGAPSLKEGFSALLCFLRQEAEPIAFGRCGSASADENFLLDAVVKRRPIPVPLPPNQLPGAPSPQVPLAPGAPLPEEDGEPFRDAAAARYDDEALADSDYFACEAHEDAHPSSPSECAEKAEGSADGADEKTVPPLRLVRRGTTYYDSVSAKLKEAFKRYPREEKLLSVFPRSEWVRTDAALLGVIYAEGLPRYLCVATETPPPAEVGENYLFVPVSVFSEEEGVYVVFQDADTGEYAKVEQS